MDNQTKKDNIIEIKSYAFAVRIVKLCKFLAKEEKYGVIMKQILKSGTSIGANVKEALQGQSPMDFVSKMSIALKEANETEYWINLLHDTEYITTEQYNSLLADNKELLRLLTSIIKSTKENHKK